MIELNPWITRVHKGMLEAGKPMNASQMLATFGPLEGKKTPSTRLQRATETGWFTKTGYGITSQYTAQAKQRSCRKWDDASNELLALHWPTQGLKCAHLFPLCDPSGVRKQAEKLRIKRVWPDKPAKPGKAKKGLKPIKREPGQSFGYIPNGAVPSIFHLGSAITSVEQV